MQNIHYTLYILLQTFLLLTFSRGGGCCNGRCSSSSSSSSGGGGCGPNLLTAGYRSRVTGGAGGVSLRAAGEQHTDIAQHVSPVIPRYRISY